MARTWAWSTMHRGRDKGNVMDVRGSCPFSSSHFHEVSEDPHVPRDSASMRVPQDGPGRRHAEGNGVHDGTLT